MEKKVIKMNNKTKIWIIIIIIVAILGLVIFKKQASYDLKRIGGIGGCSPDDCAILNYNGHLVTFSSVQQVKLHDLDGNMICRDFNEGLYNLYNGHLFHSAQYIKNEIYLLTDVGIEHKITKCSNPTWNCDLNDYSTCISYDNNCMDMSCSYLFTMTDGIWGKLGTIPIGFGVIGCEYQDGIFYVLDYNGEIKSYDTLFTLQDRYLSGAMYLVHSLAKLDNKFYTLGDYGGNVAAHIFNIDSYGYADFISDKENYLLGGSLQDFIANANKWVVG
jgi:hypothetical protein